VPVFDIQEEITVRTWDDILNRAGYQRPLEVRNFRILRIAAVYAFKELASNKNDSAVIPAIIENEADPSQRERAEQLRGLEYIYCECP